MRRHKSSAPRCGGGFTLLEVLVALALLSIALVVILQLFSANLRGIAASEDFTKASMKAESVMREILDDDKLTEKTWSENTADGYRIEAQIASTQEERTENLPVKLLQIKLVLHWTNGASERTLTLKTLKTVPKEI